MRWTRTSASPGAGRGSGAVVVAENLPGSSRMMESMSGNQRVAVLRAAAGEVVVVDRFQHLEHLGHEFEVDRLPDAGDVLADVLRAGGADESRGDGRVVHGELKGELGDVGPDGLA